MAAASCSSGELLRAPPVELAELAELAEEAEEAESTPVKGAMERPGASAAVDQASRFRVLVEEHYEFVWRSLRGLGVSHASADDAAQHVFVVASQKIAEIEAGKERSFLFGTVMGVAANQRRSQAAVREVSDDYALATAPDERRDPEQEAARREQCRILEEILDTMPEDLRVVFVLFELEGLSSTEIASLLQIPSGTAASRLRRAREDFQTRIARVHARAASKAASGSPPKVSPASSTASKPTSTRGGTP